MTGGELRFDPLVREWVTIVGHRQARPNLPEAGCPLCIGGVEAPEPYVVKAFENRWPAYMAGAPLDLDHALAASTGFTSLPARGAAEMVLYTPEHRATMASLGADGVRKVVDLWAERTEALLARPEIDYVLVFENRGRLVGATLDHPHGQIYAFPFVPPVPRREADVAALHGCALCAEVPKELAARDRVVFDDGGWAAYVPFASSWPYGLVIASREHVTDLASLDASQRDGLAAALVDVLARYDRLFDELFPYMLWIHQGMHVHVHLAPPLRTPDASRYLAAGELGSGTLSNPVVPEAAAVALREV